MYKICFYVPASHVEQVKNAMFEKKAGEIGHYTCCAWQVLGEGQFLPQSGSDAYVGELGELEKIEEYKVEMICQAQYLKDVIHAMKKTHPYEEPAYHVMLCEDI